MQKQQETSERKAQLTLYEKTITSLVSFIAIVVSIATGFVIDISDKVTDLMISRANHEIRIQHLERDNNRPPPPKYRYPPEEILKPEQRLFRKK